MRGGASVSSDTKSVPRGRGGLSVSIKTLTNEVKVVEIQCEGIEKAEGMDGGRQEEEGREGEGGLEVIQMTVTQTHTYGK